MKTSSPNACNDCHSDKTSKWAAEAVERWHGPVRKGAQSYGSAFHAARSGAPDAAAMLASLAADGAAPAFARAGALEELRPHLSPAHLDLLRASLTDADPMVRIGALDLVNALPPEQRWAFAGNSLDDPVGGVRRRAAASLAAVPTDRMPEDGRVAFERAASEFVAAQRLNDDRPEARSALAHFLTQRKEFEAAKTEYSAALRLQPGYAPAAINLADLFARTGRDKEAEDVLRRAIAAAPGTGALHHARGLALVRLKQRDEALVDFRRATELDPDNPRHGFVLAVALHAAGQSAAALATLQANLARHHSDRDTLTALVTFHREKGNAKDALVHARRLAELSPSDKRLPVLIRELEGQLSRDRN